MEFELPESSVRPVSLDADVTKLVSGPRPVTASGNWPSLPLLKGLVARLQSPPPGTPVGRYCGPSPSGLNWSPPSVETCRYSVEVTPDGPQV